MRATYSALGAVVGISILTACTSGQSGIEPPATVVNPQSNSVLQFRVGTARHADGNVYFSTLTTFRQPNGLSGTLYNTPTITGPAGFVVPTVGSAGTDAGTNHISGTPPTQPGTTAVVTTFNQSGGVFAYGFAPANSTTTGAANYAQFGGFSAANNALYADDVSAIIVGSGVGNTATNIIGADAGAIADAYMQPFYIAAQNKLPFLMGPPLTPDIHNGTYPAGFLGYDSGFTMFGITPPIAGTYTLTVNVPSATIGVNSASFSQTATLTTVAGLPAEATPPTITAVPGAVDGTGTTVGCATGQAGGGATFTTAAAAVGVTGRVLYVVDVSFDTGSPTMYSFNAGTAAGTFTVGATSGPRSGNASGAPFCAGDSVYAYVVGADFDIAGLAPPGNTTQAPTLPAQADESVSPVHEVAYDPTVVGPLNQKATVRANHHLIH